MLPVGTKSAQGIEIHYATNCVGPLLLTYLLLPALQEAAKSASRGSVRVIWSSSIAVEQGTPQGGLDIAELDQPRADPRHNYATSKVGNWFLAAETSKMPSLQDAGVMSLVQNPGTLRTGIWRNNPWLVTFLLRPFMYHARYGAYTGLWAALSKDVRIEDSGRYIIPWGRWHFAPREDISAALKSKEEGGTGRSKQFLEWCEEKIRPYR